MLFPLSLALTCVWLVSGKASQERIVASLFVTDQPNFPGPLATVAGQPFVNNFILTDYVTNATIATEQGFCIPVRTPGPAQCQYTLDFAQGTLQARRCLHFTSLSLATALQSKVSFYNWCGPLNHSIWMQISGLTYLPPLPNPSIYSRGVFSITGGEWTSRYAQQGLVRINNCCQA